MTAFKWIEIDTSGRLHVSTDESGDGWLGYALNEPVNHADISLSDALFKYKGTILFADAQSGSYIMQNAHRWEDISKSLIPVTKYKNSILWLNDLQDPHHNNRFVLPIMQKEHQTAEDITFVLGDHDFKFTMRSGLPIALKDNVLKISAQADNEIAFAGGLVPDVGLISSIRLPFAGMGRGCLIIDSVQASPKFLKPESRLPVGFQFIYASSVSDAEQALQVHQFPLFRNIPDSVELFVCICPYALPTYPRKYTAAERGTFFAFASHDAEGRPLLLESTYITSFGHPVFLQPIAVTDKFDPSQPKLELHMTVNTNSDNNSIMLAPSGDFIMSVPGFGATADKYDLLCGLSATESISFSAGDFMKFTPACPAYVSNFPPPASTTTSLPAESPDKLLRPDYATSWLQILPGVNSDDNLIKPIRYLSQPTGATLYGNGEIADQSGRQFLGFQNKGSSIDGTDPKPYPLVPYAAYRSKDETSAAEMAAFEQKIVSPARRAFIEIVKTSQTLEETTENFYNATTPSGQLVQLIDGSYEKVLLATAADNSELSFSSVDGSLLQALQTNQLFLVMTDGKSFNEQNPQTTSAFSNKISVGGWTFTVDLGKKNKYMDYSDVLIIKGRSGQGQSLSDLVKRPELWTQPDDFNASLFQTAEEPLLESPSFSGDIAGLSKWLQDYFAEAKVLEGTDSAYKAFNDLVENPCWTGVIVLKPSLGFPEQLSELMQLMSPSSGEEQAIYGHHFGVETMPVNSDLMPQAESPIFGLVNLHDKDYLLNSMKPITRISKENDFRILHLRIVMKQGDVKKFDCLAQLTKNKWFERSLKGSENERLSSNSILLEGTTQMEGNRRTYALESKSAFNFPIKGNILDYIRIDRVKYVSVSNEGGQHKNRLLIDGAIVFHKVRLFGERMFDILSFGKEGLLFNNLPLDITSTANSSDLTYEMDMKKAKFATSDRDKASAGLTLFDSISLELMNFIVGNSSEDPIQLGYLPVTASNQFIGVTKLAWYGLQFKLRAGTLGGISGNKPLELDFMLAWGGTDEDDSTGDPDKYPLFIGIKLPGGDKQLTLQNVIELEYSDIVLKYHSPKHDAPSGKQGFVLMLNQIAVKLLGLRLPPAGNVSMYLFGGGQEQGPIGWYAAYNNNE